MSNSLVPFRDAADFKAASFTPDMAGEIDCLEDVLAEVICEEHGQMPPEILRCVVAIASGALRLAEDRGIIQQMFGSAAPVKEDLEALAAKIMAAIDGDRDPQLQARCVNFVYDMGLDEGKTQTEIAREQGVNKATVSKRCIELRKKLNLPPARGMKSDLARESYRKRQTGKTRRPRGEGWVFTGLLTSVFGRPAHVA